MVELREPLSALELSRMSGALLKGNPDAQVSRLGALDELSPGVLAFFADSSMTSRVRAATGGVVFCDPSLVGERPGLTFLAVAEPKLAFTRVASRYTIKVPGSGSQAVVSPEAKLDPSVVVGPFAVIEAGAVIGKGTRDCGYVYVGANVTIGEDSELFPHVTVLEQVRIGSRVKVYPGAVIGSSGFGTFPSRAAGGLVELPQIGTVNIEDDVRIGAGTCVDRATLGETKIGRNTKIDNLSQIAHNVQIGRSNIICGCCGVGGSSKLGDGVVLGGGVLVGDNVTIAAGTQLGMSSCTTTDILEAKGYTGTPPVPVKEFLRNHLNLRKLGDLIKRVTRLEKQLGIHSGEGTPA